MGRAKYAGFNLSCFSVLPMMEILWWLYAGNLEQRLTINHIKVGTRILASHVPVCFNPESFDSCWIRQNACAFTANPWWYEYSPPPFLPNYLNWWLPKKTLFILYLLDIEMCFEGWCLALCDPESSFIFCHLTCNSIASNPLISFHHFGHCIACLFVYNEIITFLWVALHYDEFD